MSRDPFGVPWWDSKAELSCTVGATARLGSRLQEWSTAVCHQGQLFLQRYRIVNADHPGGADLAPENRETHTPHQVHLDNLALQIDDGTVDYTIAEDSLKALEICDAAYRSSFHRCRVNLPLDDFGPPPVRDWHPGQPYAGTGGGRNGRKLPGSP